MNTRKTAQMAAFFIKQQGGKISILKLQKLLYLADRESMKRHNFPMTMDRMVSMTYGPVLSGTLNLMNGSIRSDHWESLISDRANHNVALTNPLIKIEELDELSRADLAILETVWGDFGHMDQWQISDYTHDHCPEWEDPEDSVKKLSFRSVLVALGTASEEADEIDAEINAMICTNRALCA